MDKIQHNAQRVEAGEFAPSLNRLRKAMVIFRFAIAASSCGCAQIGARTKNSGQYYFIALIAHLDWKGILSLIYQESLAYLRNSNILLLLCTLEFSINLSVSIQFSVIELRNCDKNVKVQMKSRSLIELNSIFDIAKDLCIYVYWFYLRHWTRTWFKSATCAKVAVYSLPYFKQWH